MHIIYNIKYFYASSYSNQCEDSEMVADVLKLNN